MTEKFIISQYIEGTHAREELEKAIKQSNLPEGVEVLSFGEIKKKKLPEIFIVSMDVIPTTDQIRQAFKAGALDVVRATVAEHILEQLNGNE